MKNNLSWQVLIGVAVVAYVLKYLLGGVIGDAFAILGLVSLLLGIVALFKKPKNQEKEK